MTSNANEHIETVVIGGGQSGLSVGYHLKRRDRPFLILDANERVGDSWRKRWDSLRLFSPARFNGLDGMRFPAPKHSFPTKDEMADYLESYAERFDLPVRTSTQVSCLSRENGRFQLTTSTGCIEAENVVVAMGTYQRPKVPSFAAELDPEIVQLHSAEYRNPSQLADGPVLLVGAGNSGAEIAKELAPDHRVWLSGRDVGQIPFSLASFVGRHVLGPIVARGVFHRVLTIRTPIGRRMRPKVLSMSGPLIRVKGKELAAAGVERTLRTVGVQDGRPLLEDGRVLDVANVVWCTGFDPGFSEWIDLPVLGEHEPRHKAGIVPDEPGLFFVGLEFLYSLSSEMIHGVGRDADRIAKAIAERATERRDAEQPEPAAVVGAR